MELQDQENVGKIKAGLKPLSIFHVLSTIYLKLIYRSMKQSLLEEMK